VAKKSYSKYLKSGYYKTSGIEALQQQASQYVTDTEALRQQAANMLQPTFNANKLAEQQALQATLGGYNNQLSGLGLTFDQQARALNSQYDQSQNSAQANILKRGLSRGTLSAITGASIENARNLALGDVEGKRSDAYNDIYANMALAQSQSAAKTAQMEADFNAQRDAKMTELLNANQTAKANLLVQISQLNAAGYARYMARNSGGGSSHSSGGGSTTPPPSNNGGDKLAGQSSLADLLTANGVKIIKTTSKQTTTAKPTVTKPKTTSTRPLSSIEQRRLDS
jgi:hypothetical protein